MTATTEIRVAFLTYLLLTYARKFEASSNNQSADTTLILTEWRHQIEDRNSARLFILRVTNIKVIRYDLKLCFLFLQVTACEDVSLLHSTAQVKAPNTLLFIDSGRSSNVFVGASRNEQKRTGRATGNTTWPNWSLCLHTKLRLSGHTHCARAVFT